MRNLCCNVAFLMLGLFIGQSGAFLSPLPSQKLLSTSSLSRTRHAHSLVTGLDVTSTLDILQHTGNTLLAYTDDTKPTLNTEIIGVSSIGVFAGLAGIFALLTKNLKNKNFAFTLSEDEQAAVDAVEALYDPKEEDLALTEAGTVGFVRRKQLAEKAKESYQQGRDDREVRDKTLYYAEIDLAFLAVLLGAANPSGSGVFYDLGSGVGRAVLGAAKLARWKKAIGVEYLGGLHKEAIKYEGKFKRLRGSPTQFVNKDFVDVDLSDAEVVFIYATKYSRDIDDVLATAPVGARIISLDRRLNARQYKLLKTIEDPRGDLQLVFGYVYEKTA